MPPIKHRRFQFSWSSPSSFRHIIWPDFAPELILVPVCKFLSDCLFPYHALLWIGVVSSFFKRSWSKNSMTSLNVIALDSVIGKESFPLFASVTIFEASGLLDAPRFFIALSTFGLVVVLELGCTLISFFLEPTSYPSRSISSSDSCNASLHHQIHSFLAYKQKEQEFETDHLNLCHHYHHNQCNCCYQVQDQGGSHRIHFIYWWCQTPLSPMVQLLGPSHLPNLHMIFS